ncbi:MAG: HEPN domain-containing protein [Phenylobacterium sp.]|uniref:HEPN domain-containing protein n=1 Tax=Phenylobacterium sp. TaxID=1871053 RepID=UPI0027362B2A|nr:HEPN domain-containing protein [Phenylobacterium sp.]MDP3750084.1 HEPN domain-containing protein [Phenylobacterium sp.]
MAVTNLYRPEWSALDPGELRLLLNERIGGPGQLDLREGDPPSLALPEAGPNCHVRLFFPRNRLSDVRPGAAFDRAEWRAIEEEVGAALLSGVPRFGRGISFCSFRVEGSWRGERSGVQILPMMEGAPRPPVEMAEHPFILEYPVIDGGFLAVTRYRRRRDHRRLTRLLNLLLAGRTNLPDRQPDAGWAIVKSPEGHEVVWAQRSYLVDPGELLRDVPSTPAAKRIEEIEAGEYHDRSGHDGGHLRVPSDLDTSICRYLDLPESQRARFDRSLFWLDLARRQWGASVSASFASLVTAVEALLLRGASHELHCPACGKDVTHDHPGIGATFRAFLETYAPGERHQASRNKIYAVRSQVVHGDRLILFDLEAETSFDPTWWNEFNLNDDLSAVVRVALRGWLTAQN